MSWVILAVLVMYFLFAHKHVLNHFGLTERDNNLMWIGWLVPNLLIMTISFIVGAINGVFSLMPLFFIVLIAFLIYHSYSKL